MTAFTKGVFVSLLAAACIYVSVVIFKWGNSRWRKKATPFRKRVAALQAAAFRYCCPLATCRRCLQVDLSFKPGGPPARVRVREAQTNPAERMATSTSQSNLKLSIPASKVALSRCCAQLIGMYSHPSPPPLCAAS